ncbi:neuropeptide Y receptor Y8b isoform X2 [Brienomyrus brachyistius]|nr:neuropeptide Y receptor Y8b isoform X2 [Brienomyrus brachyistius]XP_048836087.1 neuropeptide Y receptor Y8b isoform X2 [Brienomyrus brachyistius]XP_048836092.1 neuropeptide Y receptor Y8b isoform X2 [Brienomyrus brachyistius]
MMNNSSRAWWGELSWDQSGQCRTSVSSTTFLIVAYSTVIAVGLIGNTCLVFIISRQKEMRNVTNIFIANLSCSDILMCIVCLPVTVIYTLMDRWILGEALCKVTPFVQCMSVTVSIFSMVLIALERHQLIIHPTGWKPVVGHSYLAVAVTWMVACFMSLPFLSFNILTNAPFQNLSLPYNPFTDHVICMELWPSERNRLAYTTSLLLFQYCLPLSLILVCYLRIFLRLRRRKDMVERTRDPRQKKAKGAKRVNVMLASIVAVFALCWLPLNVFNTVFDWHHWAIPSCQHDIIFSACHLTAMASTCVNPVIYGFLNSNFQKELKAAIYRCRCWGAPESYESFPLSTVSMEVTKVSSLSVNT